MRCLVLALVFLGVAATSPPPLGPTPTFHLSEPERTTLSNGIPVLLVRTGSVPLVDVRLVVRAGATSDPVGRPGLADWTAAMLLEGAAGKDPLAFAEAVDRLGARLSVVTGWDASTLALHAPLSRLEPALALMADAALRPSLRAEDWKRLAERRATAFLEARDDPGDLSAFAVARAVWGAEHRYGVPVQGSPASLAGATLEQVAAFHRTQWRPDRAVLVVAGAVERDQVFPLLERTFGSWKAGGPAPPERQISMPVTRRPPRKGFEVILVDRPGAAQSVLSAAGRTSETLRPFDPANAVMNNLLGGSFTSRLNDNLREQHGYAYGAGSGFDLRRRGGVFEAGASVATDVTAPALGELIRELGRIRTPASAQEVERARTYFALSFPQEFATTREVAAFWAEVETKEVPLERVRALVSSVLRVDPSTLAESADRDVRPEELVYVVVGDRSKVERDLRRAGLGPTRVWTVEDLLGPR
ncbi:MAG TPA: pitrilysin family protein [Candidatus Polarisedimenticolaceae bacterium]|nr:pitrilysin family protein [Candidatus Polarisedimenticolaceae bacterium]